uniref:Uncharacterized protein n=1 Tax=Anguilla anguilla TaxID=7936 RepID=A0A0E9VNV7_ANGAN
MVHTQFPVSQRTPSSVQTNLTRHAVLCGVQRVF